MRGISFTDFVEQRLGSRAWVLASRMTDKLRNQGYTHALTPKAYSEMQAAWAAEHPARAMQTLGPAHPVFRTMCEAAPVMLAALEQIAEWAHPDCGKGSRIHELALDTIALTRPA